MSLDLAPIIDGGFVQANALIVGFGAVLMLVFGIQIFKWVFNMLKGVFANIGG